MNDNNAQRPLYLVFNFLAHQPLNP
uniref:Uncharacterized protein n=1 Tax=Rhizophora mucronata TaxID=61149 RepID=A0A2P2NM78_RHIMU